MTRKARNEVEKDCQSSRWGWHVVTSARQRKRLAGSKTSREEAGVMGALVSRCFRLCFECM